MLRKVRVVLILVVLLLVAAPALAGGWAIVTLDSLPGEVRAGETLSVGFRVLQHGHRPTDGALATLNARNEATGERVSADARQSGDKGHYVVDVVFPSEGQWEWSIAAFGPEVQLAPLTVLPATAPIADSAPPAGTVPVQEVLRWTALAMLATSVALAVLAVRQRDVVGAPAVGD